MKKILGLTVAAILVIGLVGGGTWAYFSDTETVSSNNFTAGTLDLNLNDGSAAAINIHDTFPTDNGSAADWELANDGSIDAWLEIITSNINAIDAQADGAMLEDYVKLLLWIDANGNDLLNTGDVYLIDGGLATWSGTDDADPTSAEAFAVYTDAVDLDDFTYGDATTPCASIPGGDNLKHFRAYYYFLDNGADQNDAQGDSFELDITFTLKQQ